MSQVVLTLGHPPDTMELVFAVDTTSIAQRWLDQVRMFVAMGSAFDDRERFYNFPHTKFTPQYCADQLWHLVDILRPYVSELATVAPGEITQDLLNQLHHVFEVYHGLYDQQAHNVRFQGMSAQAQQAIAELNIWIHRMETLGQEPRFVVTWHTKPTRLPLTEEDFTQFDPVENFGDLQLNYCDIGKTLTCLWRDNDQYIGADAFRPMRHFGLDFVVKFGNRSPQQCWTQSQAIWNYYQQHQEFFTNLGYPPTHPALQVGAIRVARLQSNSDQPDLINAIGQHARIHSIIVRD